MRRTLTQGFLVILLSAAVVGQTLYQPPVPPGIQGIQGVPLITRDAIVVAEGDSVVHAWTHIPVAAAHHGLAVPPALRMGGVSTNGWAVLADGVAAYRAAGPDRTVNTGDDPMVLVRDPAALRVQVTSIVGKDPHFVPVNPVTAVLETPGSADLAILRFQGPSWSVESLTLPYALGPTAASAGHAVGDDGYVVTTVGPDGAALTADDRVFMVTGLSSAQASLDEMTLPAGVAPHQRVVTERGFVAFWDYATWPPAITLHCVRDLGPVPIFQNLLVWPPTCFNSPLAAIDVEPAPGGGLIVHRRAVPWGPDGHSYVKGLDDTPFVAHAWCGDDELIREDILLRRPPSSNAPYVLTNLRTQPPTTTTFTLPGAGEVVWDRMPDDDTLIVFRTWPWGPVFSGVTVVSDVWGTPSLYTLPVHDGAWIGGPLRLAHGRWAGFRSISPTSTTLIGLDVVTFPTASVVGRQPVSNPLPANLTHYPALPAAGAAFAMQVFIASQPQLSGVGMVVACAGVTDPVTLTTQVGFHDGALLFVDLDTLLAIETFPIASGVGTVTIPAVPAAPELAGLAVYVQASVLPHGWVRWVISDALVLTVG